MWFKGFLFLSYTALLVTPTSAAGHGQDDIKRGNAVAAEHVDWRPVRRANPWSNQTTTSTKVTKTSTTVVLTSTTTTVESTSDDPPEHKSSTTEEHVTSQSTSTTAYYTSTSTTSTPRGEEGPSSSVVSSSSSTRTPPDEPKTSSTSSSSSQQSSTSQHTSSSTTSQIYTSSSTHVDEDPKSSTLSSSSVSTYDSPTTNSPKETPTSTTAISSTSTSVSSSIERPSTTVSDSAFYTSTSSSQTGSEGQSGTTSTTDIPVSDSLTIPTDATATSISVSSTSGISLPGASGTGSQSTTSDIPSSSTSLASGPVVSSQSTGQSYAESSSSQVLPTGSTQSSISSSEISQSTGAAEPSLDFSLFSTSTPLPANQTASPTTGGPTAGTSESSGLATSRTGIPVSESLASLTATGVPTTSPGSVVESSGLVNGSIIATSNIATSNTEYVLTAGPTAINSTATPTQVDTLETSNVVNNATTGSNTASSTGSTANPSGSSTRVSGATTFSTGTRSTPPSSSSTGAAGGGGQNQDENGDDDDDDNNDSPAPLSKSQTAGIAIGGTTCLIIALVAALFIARRYHTNAAAKRHSTGSIYPEVAYLYDPPVPGSGNDDAEAGGPVPMMSGGAAGYGAVPRNSPASSPRVSTHSMPQNPFRDPIIPSPEPSPRLNGYGGPLGGSGGQYAQLAINPKAYNPAALDYPPMSPYDDDKFQIPAPAVVGAAATASPPRRRYSDPFSDPFEHDLLLHVDPRSETPDGMIFMAPPPTPVRRQFPGRENASQTSLLPPGRYSPDNSSMSTLPTGRYSPDGSSLAPSTNTNLTSSPLLTPLQRTASPPPIHKGWEEIKLDDTDYLSDNSMVPKPLFTPSAVTRKPLPTPKPKRSEPALSGAGQMLLSGQGLPLTVKRSDIGTGAKKQDRGLGLEVPSMSMVYGSPGPTIDEFSDDPSVHRKRSGELLFADPQFVGRRF